MGNIDLDTIQIAILGIGNVGKTTLVNQYVNGQFIDEYQPTVEDKYRKPYNDGKKVCVLDILDTAGQETFSTSLDSYMRKGHGFILLFSLTDSQSLEHLESVYDQLMDAIEGTLDNPYNVDEMKKRTKKAEAHKIINTIKIPLVMVGTKKDLQNEINVDIKQAESLSERFGCELKKCSIKDKEEVDQVFDDLVALVEEQRSKIVQVQKFFVDQPISDSSKKSCCSVM